MKCKYTGPWHLGISEEACENAGGKWFRTPCVTLKETIDDRPARFDLDNGVLGSCQTTIQQLTTAYVSASVSHANFTFANNELGCNEFCRGLPGYANQLAMMRYDSTSFVDTSCFCIYQNGAVPSVDALPEYATRSPPKVS